MSDDIRNVSDGAMQYKSTNTDVLGWVAEVASGRTLTSLVQENIEGAGLEGTWTCTCDKDMFPTINGGAYMTARDLARYGLLFARMGTGVHGEAVGNEEFLKTTLSDRGTTRGGGARYSNMTMTYNGCFGHGGFGGQYLLADPQSETVVSFFSVRMWLDRVVLIAFSAGSFRTTNRRCWPQVLETVDAGDNILGTYSQEIVDMMTEIINQQRETSTVHGYKHAS